MCQPCAGDHRAWVAQNEIDKVAAGAPQFICWLGYHPPCVIHKVKYIWDISGIYREIKSGWIRYVTYNPKKVGCQPIVLHMG